MRVLITGATGFIGSHLTEQLHQGGHTLRCLIRKNSNLQWIKHLPIEYVEGDYFDPESLRQAVRDVDLIYHSAGVTKAKTKAGYYEGNHLPTRNLLQAVLASNQNLIRFVHISSGAAVGPSANNEAVNESTPFHPITTYGISKKMAEEECLNVMDKIPTTIVRPPAVYGPRDKDVFEFFNTMNKGLQPMIGFKDTYVSLIHIKDLIDGIILAGEHPKAIGQTYFISSERYYKWKELGEITARILNKRVFRLRIPKTMIYTIATVAEFLSSFSPKPALINLEKAKDMVQDAWIFSIEKAKKELGFKESLSIEEGIKETVQWYRKHNWLK
ncbi:MAG: NAD-dependent epimerase/dehydratase family protein [Bacteroidota bacterium]|nr:NAD-dependent epimerase/dehydratase family protein [Bacteroidota bacterium]